jgi:hypothetical protein
MSTDKRPSGTVIVEKMLSTEVDEVPQQTSKRVIRRGFHRKE